MKKVNVIKSANSSAMVPNSSGGTTPVTVTTTTSWGSLAAAVSGTAGAVTPFVPPPYQWLSALIGAFAGAIATKVP